VVKLLSRVPAELSDAKCDGYADNVNAMMRFPRNVRGLDVHCSAEEQSGHALRLQASSECMHGLVLEGCVCGAKY
jgi:hypothetical protein